jgi:hypothetical protein
MNGPSPSDLESLARALAKVLADWWHRQTMQPGGAAGVKGMQSGRTGDSA